MQPEWIDSVAAELDKLGHTLHDLPLSTAGLNLILNDIYTDGAPPRVAALSLLEFCTQI